MRTFAILILVLTATALQASSVLKGKPRGIMVLMNGQLDPAKPIGNHPALAHANTDGMRVKVRWFKIEPSEGAYNWTPIDQAFALAKSLNKKISVSVNAGGNDCPSWLFAAGCKKHVTSSGEVIPLPADPVFKAKWTKFITAFGARYDSDPTLNYVVMTGIGHVVEWYMVDAAFFKSISPPNPPGTAKWITQAQTVIDAYAVAFPTTPFFGALAQPYSGGDGLNAEKFVVNWAANKYPGRFGIMTNTLSARSSISFYPCWAVNHYRLLQPTGFQMLWPVTYDGGIKDGYDGIHPDPNALDESLTNGVNIGGSFVEVYEVDCNNPDLQGTITFHRAQLIAN